MPTFATKPNYLIHVGRPDSEKPHESMERVEKYHVDFPDVKVLIILWTKEDVEAIEPKRNKEKTKLVLWETDEQIQSFMMEEISNIVGAQVVCPRWYLCVDKHITKTTGATMIEKCPECGGGVTFVMPEKERFERFAEIFRNVIHLTNFDTSSGIYLNKVVNPIRNLITNASVSLGCDHEKALQCSELKGSWKGKPVIVCGAGPSLEDAIPHLKRIQDKVKIICVGRSFRALRAAGVRIDYTVTVEMFDWDAAIYSGLSKEECGETIMAYASVCAPETVRAWKGKKVCLWDIETARILQRDDFILGGNSVAHHSMNFAAQILEAEPIILCGIDLAYTKPKTHAEGTTPEGWPKEMQEADKEYHHEELWVPCTDKGNNFHSECHRKVALMQGGGFAMGPTEVRSSGAYKHFATLFSILIHKHGKKVYNSCPNGQKILGADYLDLSTWEG